MGSTLFTKIPALGSEEWAVRIAQRAAKEVPAYTRLLANSGLHEIDSIASLPVTDKKGYLGRASYRDLLADDYGRTFTIFKSSGSSGQSFYWPQLKESNAASLSMMRQYLENAFHIHERRTLAIVGLALGSWIGGEHVSWVLKNLALTSSYPFSVFSPGSAHDEILSMIKNAEPFVDQFLIFLCPSAIAHLNLKAEHGGIALPHAKLRYMVLGESFPESLRTSQRQRAGASSSDPVILSMYGSADTGFLGVESAATALIRQTLTSAPEVAKALGFKGHLPHFFHFVASETYLEVVQGELCVTRWQGIPLVRYNLHDVASLYSWKSMIATVSRIGGQIPAIQPLANALQKWPDLPDVIAISGRSDGCLILCGTNLSEAMLNEAVCAETLSPWLTGLYQAQIIYAHDCQYLEFELEWRKEVDITAAAIDDVYAGLIQSLGKAQPEFLDDWRNVYGVWDQDPEKRILRLKPVLWPALSSRLEGGVKYRGTRP